MTEWSEPLDLIEKEYLEYLDIRRVTSGFEGTGSFEDLKGSAAFRELFNGIGEALDVEREIGSAGEEFVTDFARDIFLMAKWQEHLIASGKSDRSAERTIHALGSFYVELVGRIGDYLHDMSVSGMTEVLEIFIIKGGARAGSITYYHNLLKRFYGFLMKEHGLDFKFHPLAKEDIEDLRRVAEEFRTSAWEKKGEDYAKWRQRNIHHYF